MQKKLIALAIAGLASSAAFAQTNVTVYGVMDMGYINATSEITGASDLEFSGIATGNASGSRLGFKGTEDLGNGWSAGFVYEFGTLAPDGGTPSGAASANGIGATRQSHLSLSNKSMGTFQMGRIYTAAHNYVIQNDTEGASFFGPMSRLQNGTGVSINVGNNNARLNNSVAWLSPNWNGFSAQVQYSFGESGNAAVGTTDDQSYWGGGVNYVNGPLALSAGYNNFDDYAGTAGAAAERQLTEWTIGGSYNFGMLKLSGTYQDFDADNMAVISNNTATQAAAVAGNSHEGDIWHIGVSVPVMKSSEVRVSYADLSSKRRTGVLGVTRTNVDADGWGISFWHNMSKRTTLYGGYTQVDNGKGSAISVGGAGAPSLGKDSSGWGAGMRHVF